MAQKKISVVTAAPTITLSQLIKEARTIALDDKPLDAQNHDQCVKFLEYCATRLHWQAAEGVCQILAKQFNMPLGEEEIATLVKATTQAKEEAEMAIGRKAKAIFDEAADLFGRLYERWQDEKRYENINDYAKPLAPIVEKHDGRVIEMKKRPFALVFQIDTHLYQMQIASNNYSLYHMATMPKETP